MPKSTVMTETVAQYTANPPKEQVIVTLTMVLEQFRAAITAQGLTPPDIIIADGKLRKFSTNGKKYDKAGWYVLHNDGIPTGSFGDFRSGIQVPWRVDMGRPLTHVEDAWNRTKMAAIQRVRETEEVKNRAAARERAGRIWADAKPCDKHPYLDHKQVQANGTRLYRGLLTVPMMAGGVLHSLQFISANGNKRFLGGGRVMGCYYIIGSTQITTEKTAICIAEGFATAATIFAATNYPVAVAFHAGNLVSVAKAMREQFPDRPLILCADDDQATPGNPGISKATEATLAVGGLLVIPDFGNNRPTGSSDFNDLAMAQGLTAVRKIIIKLLDSATPTLTNTPTPPPAIMPVTLKTTPRTAIAEPWPDPQPITADLRPVPSFTDDLLPQPFCSWVLDIARRQSTAPDYVAVTALTALSAVIGRKARVYPKRYDDWLVVPNLWAMLIGRPSAGKTPAMREALKPLRRLADAAVEKFRLDSMEYKAALKLQELKTKTAEKNAKKALSEGDEARAMQLLASVAHELPAPKQNRYIVNDATVEKLGELLNQNPNGLLLERDELYGWLRTLDREDRSNDRTFFLEASSGDGTYTYDRIGRGTLHIPALCLSIVGGIQPARLAPYIHHAVKGGNGDDGLIQRFQLAVYPDPPHFERVDQYPNVEAQESVYQIFVDLAALKPKNNDFIPMRCSDAAQSLFYEWFDGNEQYIRQQSLHPAMESHLIKFRSLIPSLALIFELVQNPRAKSISKAAMLVACAWGQYLRQHADRIYNSAIDPVPVNALTILGKFKDGKLPNPFMYGDIRRGNWAGLVDKLDVFNALDLLEERGFIRSEIKTQSNGRPATIYHIHPNPLGERWL